MNGLVQGAHDFIGYNSRLHKSSMASWDEKLLLVRWFLSVLLAMRRLGDVSRPAGRFSRTWLFFWTGYTFLSTWAMISQNIYTRVFCNVLINSWFVLKTYGIVFNWNQDKQCINMPFRINIEYNITKKYPVLHLSGGKNILRNFLVKKILHKQIVTPLFSISNGPAMWSSPKFATLQINLLRHEDIFYIVNE